MKKVVILTNSNTELSNQLWNYVSIYSYTLERGVPLENPSFYEYGNYFTTPRPNLFLKLFFFLPFTNYTKRKNSFRRKLWSKFYKLYTTITVLTHKGLIISSVKNGQNPYYLPPTSANKDILLSEEKSDIIYFGGWLFRNPKGIEKYRNQILTYFKPRADIESQTAKKIAGIRSKYMNIIGVHIRQGDYRTWQNGKYFIDQNRTRQILDEFLKAKEISTPDILFVITSDGPVDPNIFSGLNIVVSKASAVEDLFLLSKTDAVIGSDSTFGDFAAYYGNIPHIVMQNNQIDWQYYNEMNKYVPGRYMTWVHF